MALRRPKIAVNVRQRDRVQSWLESHAYAAVRYLCAPAGSGKTTAAVLYARSRLSAVALIALEPGTTEAELIGAIAQCTGIAPTANYSELVERLRAFAPLEIIIDDIDNASAAARGFLARFYLDIPDGVTLIYLARAEAAVTLQSGRTRGLIEVCDAARLAFDAAEIVNFAEFLGLEADAGDVQDVHDVTHGWCAAVAGVCRLAAAQGLRLAEALCCWRRRNAGMLADIIRDALRPVAPDVAIAFGAFVAGGRSLDDRLETFRSNGLFVDEWDGRLVLNPLLHTACISLPIDSGVPIAPALVEMFGRFEMSIEGKAVNWIRRRDREIVAFLAMQPHGRATRADIIAAFWPDADRQLAGQSLRTACSTIRRAIAGCVGRQNVNRYFTGENILELVVPNTVISAHQFALDFTRGESADAIDDLVSALRHYRHAVFAYRAPLLAGEPPTPWVIEHQVRLATMHHIAVQRIRRLSAEPGTWSAA